MKFPIVIQIVKPGDARGWIGFGCFIMAILVLGMILFDRTLLAEDAFLILATAIIITGWVQGPVSWAYAATKGGGELADANAAALKQRAAADAGSANGVNDMQVEAETVTVKGKSK
jgi:hypothetical protein